MESELQIGLWCTESCWPSVTVSSETHRTQVSKRDFKWRPGLEATSACCRCVQPMDRGQEELNVAPKHLDDVPFCTCVAPARCLTSRFEARPGPRSPPEGRQL